MGSDSIGVALNWNPFTDRVTARHAVGEALHLGGLAQAQFKFGKARDRISLSTDGQIDTKTVVSEVTKVSIVSNDRYRVDTESKTEAAHDKSTGKAIASAPGANGNVNVVTADRANSVDAAGSISVETTVTYSDGSTEKSQAALNGRFVATGDGLARTRLDAIVGGALSEKAILQKLGIAQPASAAADAGNAPTDVGVHAAVSSNIRVGLTFVAQGDQRTVSGVESGSVDAVIATFDPSQRSYGPSGELSTTRESMTFAGTVNGGSLADSAAMWLTGSLAESTKSVTTIDGPAATVIERRSTAQAEFATTPTGMYLASQTSNDEQISSERVVDRGAAGSVRERITLHTSDSSATSDSSIDGIATSRRSHDVGPVGISIALTPIGALPFRKVTIEATSFSRLA